MSAIRTNTTARIRITIEMSAGSSWGGECPLGQVHDQASKETIRKLRGILAENGHQITIIGEPEVISSTTEMKP